MNQARRQFVAGIGALAAAGAVPAWAQASPPGHAPRLIRPPRLRPGALVGLVTPSGVSNDAHIEKCVKNLESLGFRVKPGANIRAAHGGYAGSVEQRADDLHAMFRDREVQAVWAARGGSGCSGVLPLLDYGLIRRNAKILIGYSDITALHLALHRRAGVVSFHGPVASSTFTDYTATHMLSVLMEPQSDYTIHMSIENERRAATQPQFAMRTIRSGIARGRLIGGNLSVLSALIGTPYGAEIGNRLLFLEEVGEAPYRVDRMLTQLQQSAGRNVPAAVMMGVFEKGSEKGAAEPGERQLSLAEVLDDRFAALPVPSVYGYSFGHIRHQMTLPVGVMAQLDTAEQTLTLLEPGVSA